MTSQGDPLMMFTDPNRMPVNVYLKPAGVLIEFCDYFDDGTSGALFTIEQLRQLVSLVEQAHVAAK